MAQFEDVKAKGIRRAVSNVNSNLFNDTICELWYDEKKDEIFTTELDERDKKIVSRKVFKIDYNEVREMYGSFNMKNLKKYLKYQHYKTADATWIDYYYDNRFDGRG